MAYHSAEARWRVLRELFEAHGVPFETLALASGKATGTIENRAAKEKWCAGGCADFDLDSAAHLLGRFMKEITAIQEATAEEGGLAQETEQQLTRYNSAMTSMEKALRLHAQLKKNLQLKQELIADEATHAGEDILALRADVEAFLVSIGGEEADPEISGETE